MSPVLPPIEEYYRVRLRDDTDREAVEAIALLKRVRYKGEAPTELELICQLTKIPDRAKLERRLSKIKDTPGWVEKGALYYRVTPLIIALTAFESAWSRWAKDNENEFLGRIPAAIQESFLQRASESPNPEVRETVQMFFRRFADDFKPANLADLRMVNRFVSLIETDSSLYLPLLRRVVASASPEDLAGEKRSTSGSWAPRRQLVWTMEKFVIFPEHFLDCEATLFKLAQHENEPRIANNATKIWQQLFRLQTSGTALPLDERLHLLNSRLAQATEEDAELLSGTFGEILDPTGFRMLGPPVVGGRGPPTDWVPKSQQEVMSAIMAGLQFLNDSTQHSIPIIARAAKDSFLTAIEVLTRRGWLKVLRQFVPQSHLDEADRASLASSLAVIRTWGKTSDGKAFNPEFGAELDAWIAELEPTSFHARLVGLVGVAAHVHHGQEAIWEKRLDQLAIEFLGSSELFESEVGWLTSDEAGNAFNFGARLGSADSSATLLDKIIEKSHDRQIGFLRGYVAGILYGPNSDPQIVNSRLDQLEQTDPPLSFQAALAGGSRVHVFDRAVRLIKIGKLPVYQLRNFTYWVGELRVSNEQVAEALKLLVPLAASDQFASEIIAQFLGARLHNNELGNLLMVDKELVWDAISVAARNPGRESFWASEVLKSAGPTNLPLAIRLASEGIVGSNFQFSDEAEKVLSSWAKLHPKEVMDSIGAMMLDEQKGWRFFASKFDIFNHIEEDVVISWLESVGLKGAQRIARHLPKPFIDEAGQPRVPKLTEYVLSHFEDDQGTFAEFCAGTHSFQLYTGDIAQQHEDEAASVRPFFNYPLRRIREWAHHEYQSGKRQANLHRERDDEMNP